MSGSSISWNICKSAPHSRQITTPEPHHSVFYRPNALPAAQPTALSTEGTFRSVTLQKLAQLELNYMTTENSPEAMTYSRNRRLWIFASTDVMPGAPGPRTLLPAMGLTPAEPAGLTDNGLMLYGDIWLTGDTSPLGGDPLCTTVSPLSTTHILYLR